MWGLIGHEEAVTYLERGLAQGRLAQALLLVGPPGVGKRTLALALAKALNCLGDAPPCDACPQCRRIGAGLHPDVTVYAPQENEWELGIDRVRELQRALSLKPFEGRRRVVILRDAERMSHEAANALLKTLEEPPPDAVLLLTTSEEEGLLATIRSRCQRLELHTVPRAVLLQALQENWGLAPTAVKDLAAYSQGCPGRALAALRHPETLDAVAQSLTQLKNILNGDTGSRFAEISRITSRPSNQREVAMQSLQRWRTWWRDLLLVKTGCQADLVYLQEADAYTRYSAGIALEEIAQALTSIGRGLEQLEQNANPRLVLDVLALHLPRRTQEDVVS